MSSNGEDDDTDDIEALRKAALATLKPKIQPIEQVISIGVSRTKVPEWSEVPASLDFPGFADPVPEPSPFPVSQHVPYSQPNFRQALPSSTWRSPFVNGTPAGRPRFPGFPSERRPFQHRPSHHRSFGDRGRPFYERGRRPPRGYIAGNRGGFHVNSSNSIRGSFTSNNPNRVIPLQETSSLPTPAPVHLNSSAVEPVPAGGNLIVIQPHKPEGTNNSTFQKSQEENRQQINTISHHNASSLASSPSSKLDKPPSPKPKLQLPQDRYHSPQTSVQQVKKAVPEQPPKKPKDKFSRYDKSDSEEEDDWEDNRSEADDIADEIDKFLQDYDEDVVEEEKDLATECKLETASEEPVGGTGNGSGCSDEEVSGRSSPVPSEADSLDLDALASGDPVIGDFEDLDFLVDNEPVLENSSDIARLKASDADKNVVKENARVSDKSAEILRDTSPISSSSSSSSHSVNNPASPRRDEDGINSVNDRSDTKGADLSVQHSKNTDNRSHSPVLDRSSLREQGGKLKGSRSPLNESRSIFRSRSPVHRRALSPRRLSPGRRRSVSPRRSPLRYRRSPLRGRSPRRSVSPLRRNPRRTPSPKRITSPRRQNMSQQQIFHQDRPISPHGRRHSPHGRSVSPYSANRHRNEVRSRRECDRSRNPGDNLRNRGRNRGSLSPSSRSRGGRWPDSKGRTITSPLRDERRGTGAQQAQSRESSSVGSRREDPSKGVFMDDKELEKLLPEERAKIEARRRKFGTREEVKVEDAMKTVSLKSIKERKKKPKKGEKTKEDPLNIKLPDAPTKKASEKSGISLKALRKKREQKQTEEEENSLEEEESSGHALVDLEDESEDSDTGRAWKAEGNKTKPVKLSIKSDSNVFRRGFDHVSSRFRTKLDRRSDEFRNRRPGNRERPTHRERIQSDRQKRSLSDDESDENIPSSRLGSSIVAPRVDVPPEKLRIQIQVAPKEKKKKKPKSKPDFTHVYSVPAKRRLSDDNGDDNDVEEEDDDDGEKIVMKKKSKKEKKERKEKKKKNVKDALGDTNDVLNADPVPKPRLSILERLGKKVESDTTEKKKKKKSKKSHLENEEGDDLDKHIQKMKLKNAAIERRQREIQLDKERYG